MTKISIITINYNNLKGLKKTINSVKNQTWQEFEYIIIDGFSNDGSVEYLENENDYIDYFLSEKDSGIYHAMNKGIKVAKGDYLLFLNSGDHFLNSFSLEQNHLFLNNSDLVCFDLEMKGENHTKTAKPPSQIKFSELYESSLPHPSTFIRRELFEIVGFYDENLKIVSDWKFFLLALFKYNCSYYKVDKTLSVFYLDGISNREDYSQERIDVLKSFFYGYIEDYEFMLSNRDFINSNRYKMLREIEKIFFGKKLISLFFRMFIIVFSKKKLKDIIG